MKYRKHLTRNAVTEINSEIGAVFVRVHREILWKTDTYIDVL